MTRKEFKASQRSEKAHAAARWLAPEVDRAVQEGFSEITVKVRDLREILAYMQSEHDREEIAFQGQRLGFACEAQIRDMLGGKSSGLMVRPVQGTKYSIQVTYLGLPEHEHEDGKEISVQQ